ncbi:MAG: translation elongation factor Ts [Patescibacteria group bacterium]
MTDVSLEQVKKLREKTGVGVMACRKALLEADGDMEVAEKALQEQAAMVAAERGDRETSEGLVVSYIHSDSRVGVLLELASETDFAARSEQFETTAKEIAMHICAMNPVDKEELLEQEWIRDQSKQIKDLVAELRATTKENIEIKRFARFEVGESD